jgi:hypothetical protein
MGVRRWMLIWERLGDQCRVCDRCQANRSTPLLIDADAKSELKSNPTSPYARLVTPTISTLSATRYLA